MSSRARDPRDRRLALDQAKEGKARLPVTPPLVGLPVCLLRSREVASPTPYLADLKEAVSRDVSLEVL